MVPVIGLGMPDEYWRAPTGRATAIAISITVRCLITSGFSGPGPRQLMVHTSQAHWEVPLHLGN